MAGTIPSSTAWRARLLEDRDIVGGDLQGTRSSATHGAAPMAGKRDQSQLTSRPEFLALLSSGPTRLPPSSVYVRVLKAPSPLRRSILVTSPFHSSRGRHRRAGPG